MARLTKFSDAMSSRPLFCLRSSFLIAPARDRLAYADADRRIVDRCLARGAVIVDRVTQTGQRLFEMFLQREARMVGADRNPHGRQLYYALCAMNASVTISARGEDRLA